MQDDPEVINKIVKETPGAITDEKFVIDEIDRFIRSDERKLMITGEEYYEGQHDILKAERTVIGKDGELEVVDNLPNNRIVDNQYYIHVNKKKNYLFSRPIQFSSQNELYNKHLPLIFGSKFQRTINNIAQDTLNCGIGWMYVNYNKVGELQMKRLKPYRVIPIWSDFEHDELDGVIYFYPYELNGEEVMKVECYDESGIYRFIRDGNKLIPDDVPFENHFEYRNKGYNWQKLPLIPFKYNEGEIPLIQRIKSLQDGINSIISNFKNNMEEDARNTILVLVNYDGQNLGEFRKNLSTYGAVKVRNDATTGGGDVKTLSVEVNAANYESILKIFKNALIENAKSYDAKDDRLGNAPNQMNIQTMYSDIDLDADDMETEFKASFEDLLFFVDHYLNHKGLGNYSTEEVQITFSRNTTINESEKIADARNSVGIISDQTIIENHPWVDDAEAEMERIEKEKPDDLDYGNAFARQQVGDEDEQVLDG